MALPTIPARYLPWMGLGAAALFIIGASSFFVIDQTQQALVVEFGKPVRIIQEPGLKAKVPFIQDVVMFDKRLLESNSEPKEVNLADQKRLIVDSYVRWRITDPLKFYQTVGGEAGMQDRLNSIVESSLRQVLGSVPLSALISDQRARIMQNILAIVNAQASGKPIPKDVKEDVAPEGELELAEPENHGGFGVEVVDVRIMRADLPKENSQAIYRRMQTEREREAKEFRARGEEEAQKVRAKAENERTVLLAKADKEAQITRGLGEAKATEIFGAAFNRDPEFYRFYRSLQAYRKALKAENSTMVLSPDSEFLEVFEKGPRGAQ